MTGLFFSKQKLEQQHYYDSGDPANSGDQTGDKADADGKVEKSQNEFGHQKDDEAGRHIDDEFEKQPYGGGNELDKAKNRSGAQHYCKNK